MYVYLYSVYASVDIFHFYTNALMIYLHTFNILLLVSVDICITLVLHDEL